MQALPSIIQITVLWLVPESPRWLLSKNKPKAALKVLATYHANGDEQGPLVQFQYTEVKETIALEQSVATRGWGELIATKGNRHRLFLLMTAGLSSQWSGNGLVSYYFNIILNTIGITDADSQFKINGALSIYNWVVALGNISHRNGRARPATRSAGGGLDGEWLSQGLA